MLLNRVELDRKLVQLSDGEYELYLDKGRKKRTLPQNSLWHGVWLPLIADWMGESEVEYVCREIKRNIGYCSTEKTKLGVKLVCKSTVDMTKQEMSEFLEKVEFFMAGHQVLLPQPEQI